jgi:uncharacterized protein (DUF2267 family)
MEYNEFIKKVEDLDFIKTREKADAAVKAVLGILASRLKESQAHELTEKLPAPLTYGKLRSHQMGVALAITVDVYVKDIEAQFHLQEDQARQLIMTVLHITKNALDPDTLADLKTNLPPDWAEAIQKA